MALYLFVLTFFTSSEYFNAIAILLILSSFVLTVLQFIRKKKLIGIERLLYIASVIPLLSALVVSLRAAPYYLEVNWNEYIPSLPNPADKIIQPPRLPDTLPDIYYIVLDGYGRQDIINQYYGYDNTPFIEALQDRGFIVPVNIHSNYAKTVSSIASTLNMNYTSEFIGGAEESIFWWLSKPFIEHSLVQITLEEIGYKSVAIATDWDITNNLSADLFIKPTPIHLTDYEGYLFEKSMLHFTYPWVNKLIFLPTHDTHRDLIHFSFEELSNIAKDPDPTFVFAHIVAAHPPFVFDKNGNEITPGYKFTFNDASDFPGTKEEYRIGYTGQIQYINRLIEDMVDEILARSETPPIIILQADHGPGLQTDFTSAENTCLQERFSIFAAYHLPNYDPQTIPDDLTPINLFRLIFNEYFSTELPLLENSSFYPNKPIYVYEGEDITARLASDQGSACETFLP